MNKLTKNQTLKIMDHTPLELDGQPVTLAETLGAYTPANANWSIICGWNHSSQLVATRFGRTISSKIFYI